MTGSNWSTVSQSVRGLQHEWMPALSRAPGALFTCQAARLQSLSFVRRYLTHSGELSLSFLRNMQIGELINRHEETYVPMDVAHTPDDLSSIALTRIGFAIF